MLRSILRGLLVVLIAGAGDIGASGLSLGADRSPPAQECKPGDFPVTCPAFDDYNQATAQFDIAKAINLPGRVARIHYSVLAPGGVINQHSHKNRPCFEYMLEGEAVETKQDGTNPVVVRTVKKDEVEMEPSSVVHWWKNQSSKTARMIAVDIFEDPKPAICNCYTGRGSAFTPPAKASNAKIEKLGEISLATEYPGNPAMANYVMTSRRITLPPGQVTALENSNGRPSYTYVVKGNPVENRSDKEPSVLRPEEFSITDGNTSYFWQNPTSETVVLWVVAFEHKATAASGGVSTKK